MSFSFGFWKYIGTFNSEMPWTQWIKADSSYGINSVIILFSLFILYVLSCFNSGPLIFEFWWHWIYEANIIRKDMDSAEITMWSSDLKKHHSIDVFKQPTSVWSCLLKLLNCYISSSEGIGNMKCDLFRCLKVVFFISLTLGFSLSS